MARFINLKSIDVNELDSRVRSFGNRLFVYFDFKNTAYSAVCLPDMKSNMHVVYSEDRSMCKTYEEKMEKLYESEKIDFHDCINKMAEKCLDNYICEGTNFSKFTNTICDVVHIPEIKGLCFITAGYKIGRACAEALYGDDKDDEVTFTINKGSIITISGNELKRIASRFVVRDVEISSNIGYSYYNKSISDGQKNKVCTNNFKRFGIGESVINLTTLMRNFTEFVPIGFSWSVYTPMWMKSKVFVDKICKESKFGYDILIVPNYSVDGRELRNVTSTTLMTTRRRIHEVLGLNFKYYNFKLINEIMAGLFYEGCLNVSPKYIYIKKTMNLNKPKDQNKKEYPEYINRLQYEALTDEEKINYEEGTSNQLIALPLSMANKYWKTMDSTQFTESPVSRIFGVSLNTLSFDGILYADVEADTRVSTNLFGYVD